MSITLIRLALVTAAALTTSIYAAADAGGDPSKHPVFDKIDTDQDDKISLAEWIAFRDAHKKPREPRKEHQPAAAK